jgi:hypothetical protein
MYAAVVVTSVSESRIVVMFTALKDPCTAVLMDLIDDGATDCIDEMSNCDLGPGRDVRRTNGHGLHHRSPERRLALSVIPQPLHRSPPLDPDHEVVSTSSAIRAISEESAIPRTSPWCDPA